jgi:hypothetical protein
MLAAQVALSREKRQPEFDSVEGDLMGECVLRTSLFASDAELLAPLRIGMLRQHLRHRRLDDAVRAHCVFAARMTNNTNLKHPPFCAHIHGADDVDDNDYSCSANWSFGSLSSSECGCALRP